MARPKEEIGGRARRTTGPGAFRAGVVLAVLLLGVVGFAAAVVLSGWADELRPDDVSGEHVLSNSATGYGGLLRLLQETEVDTAIVRRTPKTRGVFDYRNSGNMRVYTLSRPATRGTFDDIADDIRELRGDGGPVLFVLPKWRTVPVEDARKAGLGWVRPAPRISLYSAARVGGGLDRFGPELVMARESGIETYEIDRERAYEIGDLAGFVTDVKIDSLQYLAEGWTDVATIGDMSAEDSAVLDELYGPEETVDDAVEFSADTPLFDGDFDPDGGPSENIDSVFIGETINSDLFIGPDLMIEGRPVFFSVHDRDGVMLYHVLTDPDLLNTHGLSTLSRAKLGLGIVEHVRALDTSDGTIAFDLTLHGFARSSNIIKTMTRPPLLAATLCALATLLLVGWMAFGRFGDPLRRGELAPAGSGKRSLIENGARLVGLARRTLGLADDYAELRRRRILKALRVDGGRAERVEAALKGLSERVETDIPAEIARVEQAGDPAELVRAARRLHDITETVT